MALQLIRDMTGKWDPSAYTDKFTSAIHALAAQRVKAGETEKVTPLEDASAVPGAAGNVVDLTELLKKSLASRKSGGGDSGAASAAAPGRKSAAKKSASARSAKATASTKAKRAA
jgi:DNA end-binding protein Ku